MVKDNSHEVYISFGSNKGNRLNYIVNSLKELEVQVGRIVRVSNLYKTESWGFKSRDFYNGCVILKTKFSPQIVLKKLLSIEDILGRTRSRVDKYSSREIDLDLLFFDQLILSSQDLMLPHPNLNKRNFVLIPMFDIAPEFIHPIIKKSIKNLLLISKDNSVIKKIKNNNYYIPFWERFSFISIEGNIGVGKTTLSKKIELHFDIESLNENYKLNPYLEDFYNNPNDFSFKLESFFLNERVGQINKHFLISQ
jgi:2-amino-4-hydroxy-6-hydroxymethyldihydropteridine diphosphokinase